MIHTMQGQVCILPMSQIDGTRLLRLSVPMLMQDSLLVELSLDGLDVDRLSKNRP